MRTRPVVLLALAALVLPAHAFGQSNPLAPLPQSSPDQTTPQVQTVPSSSSSADDGGGLGTLGEILIYGSGALLLVGVAWLIVRDARRRAPIEEDRVSQPRGTHSPQRHARARAKAKAARQQRKRNRAKR